MERRPAHGFAGKVCVNLPNKFCKFWEETHCFQENFIQQEKFYTTAGRDRREKFQVCMGKLGKKTVLKYFVGGILIPCRISCDQGATQNMLRKLDWQE